MGSKDLGRLRIENKETAFSEGASRSSFRPLVLGAVFGILAGIMLGRNSLSGESTGEQAGPRASAKGGEPVSTSPAASSPSGAAESGASASSASVPAGTGRLDSTGYVVAQRKAAVSSKATGRLETLLVKEGDFVKVGDVIGILENEDAKALVAEREASVTAANSRVLSSAAELEDARKQRERINTINDARAVSQTDRDNIDARFRRAAADLDANKANVGVEKARLEKAKVDLEYTFIRAPFTGTVLTKNADIGEVVAPFGSSADARGAVVTLADMDSLQVEADVSEANLAKVKLGQKCDVTLDSYPEKIYIGEVESIVPTVDRAKATVTVKIKFLNKDDRVIPEMSAKVSFKL